MSSKTKAFCFLAALFFLAGASAAVFGAQPFGDDDSTASAAYLPLTAGRTWVLRDRHKSASVTLTVIEQQHNGYQVRFDNPWVQNAWTLSPHDGRYDMTAYTANGKTGPLPEGTVYFDFKAAEGKEWSNAIGTMKVISRHKTVATSERTYNDCIEIRQTGKGGERFFWTFAPGVGFVQFGEGDSAFTLDESASSLGAVAKATPTPVATPRSYPTAHPGKVLFGLTVNPFANEGTSNQALQRQFDRSVQAGITFMVSSGKWDEIEPQTGHYKFDSLDYQVTQAQKLNLPIAYTLRLIDTVDRTMPAELKKTRWTDEKMRKRVLQLVDALAPHFKDRVRWFMFGNEIDGYFTQKPSEVSDYVELYRIVSERIKQRVPGIQVSSTVMYGGIDHLNGLLKPLENNFDFLAFTYYPLNPDFTVRDPDTARPDLARIRAAAKGRKVVMQEIGYPTSPLNNSSEEKQAQFFQNVSSELRANSDVFVAANFFLLADLSDSFVNDLARFYRLPNAKVFRAYLQTLGMFDLQGRPKKSWPVFLQEARR
jgi:hypothetical protein